MDKHTVADIDANVAYIVAAGVEAENITGLQLINMDAVEGLIGRNAVKGIAVLAVHIVDKAAAVKACRGILTAPCVIIAHKLQGIGGNQVLSFCGILTLRELFL